MSGGDRREPLWASSLADQQSAGYDDVVVRVLEEPEDELPKSPPRPPGGAPRDRRSLVAASIVAVVVFGVAIALEGRGSLTIADVPSGWGDVPLTCDTVRIEQGDRAVEHFRCRAIGGRPLPAGLYESPGSQWTSDITRRPARRSRIRISRDGLVTGWATY